MVATPFRQHQAHCQNGVPLPFSPQTPHLHGTVNKSRTLRWVLILVQLNKCVVVCGSVLPRGNSSHGFWSSLILFKYDSNVGHLFVLSWVRVPGCSEECCFGKVR